MAASYVLVTSAVVALAGAVFLVLVAPRLVSAADVGARVRTTATQDAATLTAITTRLGRLPNAAELRTQLGRLAPGSDNPVCDRAVALGPGQAKATGDGVAIPCVQGALGDTGPMSLMLLVAADGKVVATSYPGRYPVGARAADLLAVESVDDLGRGAAAGGVGGRTPRGGVLWALEPVRPPGRRGAAGPRLGSVYVQVPADGIAGPPVRDLLALLLPWASRSGGGRVAGLAANAPLAQLAVALLLVTVPVGLLLGLLGTARLRRRLRRLASTSAGMAAGGLQQRVPVSGRDEVAQVEDGLNRMAEWLWAELEAKRQLSDGAVADAERSRATRELHESILSDLSSLTMLAGGLRRALPPGSPLGTGVEAIESTATGVIQQVQALASPLGSAREREDTGLVPAVQELCGAYEARFGVAVDADVATGELAEPVERAVLQVAREALADAVKHRGPGRIALRIAMDERQVEVDLRDDGRGVDPRTPAGGQEPGLDLLRKGVDQLGGTLRLDRRPGTGTRVRVLLPRGPV
jgi:two-component system, NarL family, sensor histidine kinase LiaS